MLKMGALFGLLLVVITIPAAAQEAGPIEASAGYSLRVYTAPDYSHSALNGWYGSADYNILHRIGAAAEISGTYKDQGTNGNLRFTVPWLVPRFIHSDTNIRSRLLPMFCSA